MKTKTLVAFAAFVPVLAASIAADAAPTPARPGSVQPQQPIGKIRTELKLATQSTVPGEKKTYDVVLDDGTGKPVADKMVQLALASKPGGPALSKQILIGDVKTAANGHAVFTWSCPDLKMGNFDLEATFAGDPGALPSKVSANILVVKAMATWVLDNMTWGTYKDEPGEPGGSITVKLVRNSDQKYLDKPATISVNGTSWATSTSGGYSQYGLTPKTAKSWDVKLQFDGDDYTQAAAGERKYTHP